MHPGNATLTTSALAAGTHTITATYPGTIDFLPSSATLSQNVLPPPPVGSFTLSATPAYQEVKGAGSNVYQITVTSVNGFAGPVTLTCCGPRSGRELRLLAGNRHFDGRRHRAGDPHHDHNFERCAGCC